MTRLPRKYFNSILPPNWRHLRQAPDRSCRAPENCQILLFPSGPPDTNKTWSKQTHPLSHARTDPVRDPRGKWPNGMYCWDVWCGGSSDEPSPRSRSPSVIRSSLRRLHQLTNRTPNSPVHLHKRFNYFDSVRTWFINGIIVYVRNINNGSSGENGFITTPPN